MNTASPLSYRLMVLVLSPLLLGYTFWRSFKDGGWTYFTQRLGYNYPSEAHAAKLWVHAASVGEVNTVLPLLETVLADSDNTFDKILLTTNTPTAKQVLGKRGSRGITHAYLPVDFAGSCKRFLRRLNTHEGWIVETEIWPSLYASCRKHSISLTIINARLSDKTMRHAVGRLRKSYASALSDVRVLARSPLDKDRYISIGADSANVTVIGNLKYMDHRLQENLGALLDRDYVLAASTHEDEEVRLAKHWLAVSNTPLLVIVPRHPERAAAIMRSLQSLSEIRIAQRSLGEEPQPEDQLYLADTLGELTAWYASAKATFVGGSLVQRGGHNMLEAARLGVPVVVGPYTENFADVMQVLLEADAINVAQEEQTLVSMLNSAAAEQSPYAERAENAVAVAESLSNVGDAYKAVLLDKPA